MSILINNHNSKHSKVLLDTLKNELSVGTTISIKLGGYSMWPIIKPNTNAIIKKINISNLKKGDVIVFSAQNKLIAHRIIQLSNNSLITKGDNEFNNDGKLKSENYYGKIISLERNSKITYFDSKFDIIISFLLAKFSYILTPIYRFIFKLIKY